MELAAGRECSPSNSESLLPRVAGSYTRPSSSSPRCYRASTASDPAAFPRRLRTVVCGQCRGPCTPCVGPCSSTATTTATAVTGVEAQAQCGSQPPIKFLVTPSLTLIIPRASLGTRPGNSACLPGWQSGCHKRPPCHIFARPRSPCINSHCRPHASTVARTPHADTCSRRNNRWQRVPPESCTVCHK